MIDEFDVQVHGVNSADEQLNGVSPNLGTETCNIADFTYSNEWLLRVTGNARVHGDRLEKAFHNAAPGAVNRTFTGHVYNQNPNLVMINSSSEGYHNCQANGECRWQMQWFHHPPCCSGNVNRLLPNYIHHMWYGTPDGGLAATMYGPNHVIAPVGKQATPVEISVTTAYPFEDKIVMNVNHTNTAPVTFPLLLRIPAWCSKPVLVVAGKATSAIPDAEGFVRVERAWESGDTVILTLPAEVTATKKLTFADGTSKAHWNPDHPARGANATSGLPFCVVERGSLTFALPLEETPAGPYGYAIECDAQSMELTTGPMPSGAWDWPLDAPMKLKVRARPFAWRDAWLMPSKPISDMETEGPTQELTLVPYGNAKVLHISMFPFLDSRIEIV